MKSSKRVLLSVSDFQFWMVLLRLQPFECSLTHEVSEESTPPLGAEMSPLLQCEPAGLHGPVLAHDHDTCCQHEGWGKESKPGGLLWSLRPLMNTSPSYFLLPLRPSVHPLLPPRSDHTARPSSQGTPCTANSEACRAQRLGKQLLCSGPTLHAKRRRAQGGPPLCHSSINRAATMLQLRGPTRRNAPPNIKDEHNN